MTTNVPIVSLSQKIILYVLMYEALIQVVTGISAGAWEGESTVTLWRSVGHWYYLDKICNFSSYDLK